MRTRWMTSLGACRRRKVRSLGGHYNQEIVALTAIRHTLERNTTLLEISSRVFSLSSPHESRTVCPIYTVTPRPVSLKYPSTRRVHQRLAHVSQTSQECHLRRGIRRERARGIAGCLQRPRDSAEVGGGVFPLSCTSPPASRWATCPVGIPPRASLTGQSDGRDKCTSAWANTTEPRNASARTRRG